MEGKAWKAYLRQLDRMVILWVAFALSFYRLTGISLWGDELTTATVHLPRLPLQLLTTFSSNNHTLYTLLAKVGVYLLGQSDFAIRLPAACFAVLGVAAFYTLLLRMYQRDTALLGAWLLAMLPTYLTYAQQARGYTAALCFTALAACGLWQGLARGQSRDWALFAGASLAACLSHLIGGLLAWGGLSLYGLIAVAKRDRRWRVGFLLVQAGFALLMGALLILWWPGINQHAQSLTQLHDDLTPLNVKAAHNLLNQLSPVATSNPWFWIYVMLVLLALVGLYRREARSATALLLTWLLAPLAVVMAMKAVRPQIYFPMRFLLPLILPVVGLIAAGIKSLRLKLASFEWWRPLFSWLMTGGLALMLAASLIPGVRDHYTALHENYRAAAVLIHARYQPGDVIIVYGHPWRPDREQVLLGWYGLPADTHTGRNDIGWLQEQLTARHAVWVVANGFQAWPHMTPELRAWLNDEFISVPFTHMRVFYRPDTTRRPSAAERLALLSEAAALDPIDASVRFPLLFTQMRMHQTEAADVTATQLLRLRPDNGWVYFQVGRLAEIRGEPAAALIAYKQALILDPTLEEAKASLARLEGVQMNAGGQ